VASLVVAATGTMAKSRISPFFRERLDSDDQPEARNKSPIMRPIERIIDDGVRLQELEPEKRHYENAIDFAKSLYYSED